MDERYKRAAEYVANQCTGCSVSTMILAFKAYNAMVEAEKKSQNPYISLNEFLGTNFLELTFNNM